MCRMNFVRYSAGFSNIEITYAAKEWSSGCSLLHLLESGKVLTGWINYVDILCAYIIIVCLP